MENQPTEAQEEPKQELETHGLDLSQFAKEGFEIVKIEKTEVPMETDEEAFDPGPPPEEYMSAKLDQMKRAWSKRFMEQHEAWLDENIKKQLSEKTYKLLKSGNPEAIAYVASHLVLLEEPTNPFKKGFQWDGVITSTWEYQLPKVEDAAAEVETTETENGE